MEQSLLWNLREIFDLLQGRVATQKIVKKMLRLQYAGQQ